MMFLWIIIPIALIYFIWQSNNSSKEYFTPKNNVQSLSDDELEAELAKRKGNAHLESEIAELKKKLSELKIRL